MTDMTATITVAQAYANTPPSPAKVVDDQGGVWKYWTPEGQAFPFVQGQTYNVSYKSKSYKGQNDNIISGYTPHNGAAVAPVAAAAPPLPAPTPVQAASTGPFPPFATGVTGPTPAPTPQQTASNGRYTDWDRAEDIFVTGYVGRIGAALVAAGNVADAAVLTKEAVAAWSDRHRAEAPHTVVTDEQRAHEHIPLAGPDDYINLG